MVRLVWRGKGHTKVPEPVVGDDLGAAFDHLKRRSTFEGWVADAEQEARKGLLSAGYTEDNLANSKDLTAIHYEAEPDSDVDFYARILERLQRVRREIKDGNAERAAGQALDLGATIQLHVVRIRQPRSGRKPDDERNLELARKYLQQRPTSKLKDWRLKAKIGAAEEPPLKRSAAIAAINAGLKMLSG